MIYYETNERLIKECIKKGLKLTKDGILYFNTGKFTGRSPKDRYFVEGEYTNTNVDFSRAINQRIGRDTYISLKREIIEYLEYKKTYEGRKVAGYNHDHSVTFNIESTEVWAVLFFNNMLIDPTSYARTYSNSFTEWDILHAPNFVSVNDYSGLNNDNFVAKVVQKVAKQHKVPFTEDLNTAISYYLKRDYIGLDKFDPIIKDRHVKKVICEGLNKPLIVQYEGEEIKFS